MIDPEYRDWMTGSNHPLDNSAKLNSNTKIKTKWDGEYRAIQKTIAKKHADAKALAELKMQKRLANDQRILENYLQKKSEQKQDNREKRKKKRHLRQLEKQWVQEKIVANQAWVQNDAAHVLAQEVQQERDRIQKSKELQAKFDGIWRANRSQLLERTTHYRGKELPRDQCVSVTRDLPGEIEWRTKQQRSRPRSTISEQTFYKTVPFFGRGVTPLTQPLLRTMSRCALSPAKHWEPAAWSLPPERPWRVTQAGTGVQDPIVEPHVPAAPPDDSPMKALKVGNTVNLERLGEHGSLVNSREIEIVASPPYMLFNK